MPDPTYGRQPRFTHLPRRYVPDSTHPCEWLQAAALQLEAMLDFQVGPPGLVPVAMNSLLHGYLLAMCWLSLGGGKCPGAGHFWLFFLAFGDLYLGQRRLPLEIRGFCCWPASSGDPGCATWPHDEHQTFYCWPASSGHPVCAT